MKTATALIATFAALAVVSARPMHAGINYARYLEQKEAVADELDAWMSKYSDDAEINGWIPPAESRDADEVAEDRKQRFFMAKELVTKLKEENPGAEFSTDSPFSLLTPDEFSKYVTNSYVAGGGVRQLRSMEDNQDSGNAAAHPFSFREAIAKWWNSEDSQSSNVRSSESFSFQDLIDWINQNYRPSGQPSTTPTAGRSASRPAAAETNAPIAQRPTTPRPTTPRPTGTPASKAPVTSAPTRAPVVAPTNSPVGPVGPVTPADTPNAPTPAKPEDGEIGGDGSGVDWSKNKCMPPVQNQGQCGDCWAFAAIAGIETGKCITSEASSFVKLSEQQLATCDTRNKGCNGGNTFYALRFLQQNGACTAADAPYTLGNGQTKGCSSCNAVATGVKGSKRVQGESGLVSALNSQPVVVAVAAGNAAWKQYKSGVLSSCQTTRMDHAVLAVGYDTTSFKIRNSWGARWGEAGYIRIKRDAGSAGVCSMYGEMLQTTF